MNEPYLTHEMIDGRIVATGYERVQHIEYYPNGKVKQIERVVCGFGGGMMKFIDRYPNDPC